jgi:hypothetical protein
MADIDCFVRMEGTDLEEDIANWKGQDTAD